MTRPLSPESTLDADGYCRLGCYWPCEHRGEVFWPNYDDWLARLPDDLRRLQADYQMTPQDVAAAWWVFRAAWQLAVREQQRRRTDARRRMLLTRTPPRRPVIP